MKNMVLVASVVCLVLAAGAAGGEDTFGVAVYPGAKSDAETKKKCDFVDRSGKTAKCFRTSDEFSKVLAFYQKQANLAPLASYKTMPAEMVKDMTAGPIKGYRLCKKSSDDLCGTAVPSTVAIESPWTMKPFVSPTVPPSAYEHRDVLIMITTY